MRSSILFALLLISFSAFSQTGNYFLSHFAPGVKTSDNVCFDIAQDSRGMIYFATTGGILKFDGRHWDLLKRKNAVYGIYVTANDEIYWAGVSGFGKVGYDEHGFQKLDVLLDSIDAHVIQVITAGSSAYFLSTDKIYVYDRQAGRVSEIAAGKDAGSLSRIFELFGAVYVTTGQSQVFKVDGNSLAPSKLAFGGDVAFVSRIGNNYVIGTTANEVLTCDESLVLSRIQIADQDYLDASVIISGSWINRHLLALGTLRGGVVFINPITGRTQEIVNYGTGLPDNEVFALMTDKQQNVWVAHDYGFTRISPYMPFRSFSHYEGLDGNLLCAFAADDGVYVGTSLGLFKLQKQDVYDEITYFVNVTVPSKGTRTQEKNELTTPGTEEVTTESRRRGVFSFLRRKDKREKVDPSKSPVDTQAKSDVPPTATGPSFRREKRTQKVLRASHFAYHRVQGIDSKITHLTEINGRLIASGLGGIYEVSGLAAKALLREPVHYLYASRNENILFASTYDDRVRSLVLESGVWQQVDLLDNINDRIDLIFEAEDRTLWLCGMGKLYQYEVTDYNVNPLHAIELSNADPGKTLGISWDGKVLFANRDGFFRYEPQRRALEKIDSLPSPSKYFAQQASMIYRDGHGWNLAGRNTSHANLNLLDLFQDLRFLTSDAAGNLWMISGSNELYKFFNEKPAVDYDPFPVVLRSITNQGQKSGSSARIEIIEDKSDVNFEIVQPDYVSPDAIEYRYRVAGMRDEWSEWSVQHSQIAFGHLAPGDYVLEVESRNIFGKVSTLRPFTFQVLPPYWKRPWFYAMEFAMIASLVLLSFRLNSRYRIVSKLLTLLTIILLIEFMQTVIDSTIRFNEESPVIDFIIQVVIALLILPVEGYLRKLMFRSLDTSSKFYQFIMARSPGQPEVAPRKEELQPTDES